ncbi:ABC transporter ATP-binding protein [Saxibacter everestensis]|uniref:ABC transporter ATP-binding protein n=1 Tax=Saxibacter everestensis TaxID=2909229 RepID=A0ABY8QRG4_9MICO|nr:ABC transporter ATP-binding protein [Brevibacteriaceae bacterium ZFBP1038]
MSSLEFSDVTVTFGHGSSSFDAVRRVSLVVPEGGILGLVGESGSGKSTLARAAVGLVEPSSGDILLDGSPVTHARGVAARQRQRIQMIFQDPQSCLDPRRTVGQSVDESLTALDRRRRQRPRPVVDRDTEIARLLETVNLDPDYAHRLPGALSGGQRQRVAIARALAAGPDVLLADEITSALDVSVQGSVLNLLRELQEALQLTVLFISHNLAVVRHVCERVAVMLHGEIVEEGHVLDVLEDPQHEYTKRLLAAVPQIGVPLFPADSR